MAVKDKSKTFLHLKNELEAVASQELRLVLDSWGHWTPAEELQLKNYLNSEMGGGTLSIAKAQECEMSLGVVRAEARRLLKKLS